MSLEWHPPPGGKLRIRIAPRRAELGRRLWVGL